jgi:hypothetical protein
MNYCGCGVVMDRHWIRRVRIPVGQLVRMKYRGILDIYSKCCSREVLVSGLFESFCSIWSSESNSIKAV